MGHGDRWGAKILPAHEVINVPIAVGSQVASGRTRIGGARTWPRIASETGQAQPGNPSRGSPAPAEHLPACPVNRHSHLTRQPKHTYRFTYV